MKTRKSVVYMFVLIFVFVSVFANSTFLPVKSLSAEGINYYRGVNLAGPGFSSGTYWINQDMVNYYAGKGFDIFRVSLLWERIQPTLGGPLDATYLQGLKDQITRINNAGKKAIIDLHNYCRYNGVVIDSSNEVTSADFADVWDKMSAEFKTNDAVYAYDLMNEPNGIDIAVWKTASQAAVSAIRSNNDDTLLIIEGVNYSHPEYWESYNATTSGWISDPSHNTMYSAHVYFDYDGSGTYKKSYDEELAANPELNMIGVKRIHDFLVWCSKNNARGFIGEFGIPKDDERWNPVLENFMDALDEYGMDATYWAGGAWSTSYNLNLNPINGVDSKPMSVLVNHLSGSIPAIPAPPAGLYEAESLTVNATNKSHTITTTTKASGGKYDLFNGYTANDYIEYKVNAPQAGTYTVKVRIKAASNNGIYQVSVNGTNQGSQFDAYLIYGGYNIYDLGEVTFSSAGDKLLRFTCKGKNGSASGYKLSIDAIQMKPLSINPTPTPTPTPTTTPTPTPTTTQTPTSVPTIYEAESLAVNATNKTHSISNNTRASGGQYDLFNGYAANDYIEYKVNVAEAGTYNVNVRIMRYSNNGIYQLSVNGVNQGAAFDTYEPSGYYMDYDLGSITFDSSGDKLFRFTCSGKNSSSVGYKLPTDYIMLTKQ